MQNVPLSPTLSSASSNPALQRPPLALFLGQMWPTLFSLLAVSSTTIIDGIFIGKHVGSEGLAALNLLNPPLNVLFGLALMLAIGAAVRAGALIGAGRSDEASDLFTKTLLSVLLLSLLLVLGCFAFQSQVFRLLGATPELLPLMTDYFVMILPFFVVKAQIIVLYFFIRLDGSPGLVAASFGLAALVKLGLSVLLVAQWGWGLRGAALGTGIAHLLAGLLLLQYFRQRHRKLHWVRPRGSWWPAWRCAGNGVSEFINEVSVSSVAFILNWLLLLRLGVQGVAAIAVYNYLLQIALMLYFAIAHASQTLISQNLGAGLDGRVRDFLKLALGFALGAGLLCTTLVLWFTAPLVRVFLDSEAAQASMLAQATLQMLWPVLLLAGLNVAITGYFTALQHAATSALLSILRSLLLPALLLVLLFQLQPGRQFLYGLALAEALTLVAALLLLWRARERGLTRS